jgi:hypothetical protein
VIADTVLAATNQPFESINTTVNEFADNADTYLGETVNVSDEIKAVRN